MDTAMTYIAPRRCTVVNEGEATRDERKSAAPLSGYANAAAYVLIAEPGAGKATAFETEAASRGGHVCHSQGLSDLRRQAGVA